MAKITTDAEIIRRWADEHGGKPAVVSRTHDEQGVGIIRIMFPESAQSDHDALEEISWDEFFEQFEASELALLYEEDGQFNKLVGRDTAEARANGEHNAAR